MTGRFKFFCLSSLKYEGRVKLTPHKKLPSKSPALLGLMLLKMGLISIIAFCMFNVFSRGRSSSELILIFIDQL